MIEFTSSMVRMLKGAPLSCLILLALEPQAVSAQYLERNTGYSDKLVHSALLLLEERGLVTRNARYSWQIASGVRQLPLMQALIGPGEEELEPISEEVIDADEKPAEQESGSRRNSESENFRVPTSSSSSRTLTKSLEINNLQPLEGCDPENFRVRENLQACQEAGIMEPKRSMLARLPHATAAKIRFHVKTAPAIGAAIYRIEHDWEVRDGEAANDRRKYIEGEYADCIER